MDRIHDGKTIQTLYKNDDIEADIDDLGCDGEGIAHIDGYTVFVPYALPGERVRAHIVLAKPTFAVGNPAVAEYRRDSRYAGECGGKQTARTAFCRGESKPLRFQFGNQTHGKLLQFLIHRWGGISGRPASCLQRRPPP